ncbi:MAG: methyltransferase domain-containing protein [Acidimicrobiia bacterium]
MGVYDSWQHVGGGASRLVDHLLALGFTDVIVADLAANALAASRARLGDAAAGVTWLVADARTLRLDRSVTVWHDRAVFHFLTDPTDRATYVESARAAVPVGGHVVIATFGPDGPETCSGLPTCRYDATGLAAEFGDGFELVESCEEVHVTPSGATQQFVDVVLRRVS